MSRLMMETCKIILPMTCCLLFLVILGSDSQGQGGSPQYAPSGSAERYYGNQGTRYDSDVYAGSTGYSASESRSRSGSVSTIDPKNRPLRRNREANAMSAEQAQREIHIDPAVSAASTRRVSRQNAESAISQMNFSVQSKQKVQTVLDNVSIYRRLPVYAVDCNLSMMNFLIQKPEIIVGLWEKMDISQIQVQQIPNYPNFYNVEDVAGTKGYLQYLWRSSNMALCYIEGRYEGSMTPRPIRGRGLVLIRLMSQYSAPGKEKTLCYVDSFMSFDQEMVDLVSRLLNPMLGRVADNNLEQTLAFVNWFADSCRTKPYNVTVFINGLDHVGSEAKVEISRQIWSMAQQNGFAVSDEQIESLVSTLKPSEDNEIAGSNAFAAARYATYKVAADENGGTPAAPGFSAPNAYIVPGEKAPLPAPAEKSANVYHYYSSSMTPPAMPQEPTGPELPGTPLPSESDSADSEPTVDDASLDAGSNVALPTDIIAE